MNSGKSKASDFHILFHNLPDKQAYKGAINMLLYQILALSSLILACTHGKNIKTSHKNNKFKISAPTWNDKFELLDE